MRKVTALFLALLLVASFVGCGEKQESVVEAKELKFSISAPATSSWNDGAKKFVELVDEKSDGKFKIKIFLNDELSGGNQVAGIEMVQSGATDIHLHDALVWSSIAKKVILPCMPWLLPTFEDVDKYMEGEGGEALKEVLNESGVVCLSIGENGYRQAANTKRPIETVADMKGLKMRIPGSNAHVSILKHLGADPITMSQSEVYTSLQQGAIDACENTLDLLFSQNTLEVVDHLTFWNYSYDPIFLTVSTKLWDSLTEEEKNIFQEAADEAMRYQKEVCRDELDVLYNKIVEKYPDVEIVDGLSDDALDEFVEAVSPVYDEFKDEIGEELFEKFGYKFN